MVEVAKMRGEYVAPTHARMTVAQLGPAWLDRRRGHLKPSSYRVMEIEWRVRVAPRWGKVGIGDIRPTAVQRWVSDLSHGVDGATPVGASVVSRAHHVLASILADAVRDHLLAANPATDIKLPSQEPQASGLPDPPAGGRTGRSRRPLRASAAAAGLHRPALGEAVGLRVRDLDMLRRRATISENAVQVGQEICVGTPKAHKRRSVPLPEFLLPYLARQCDGRDRDDLLFPGKDGGHLKRPRTDGWFVKAVAVSGVPRVTPHDLRHSAASLAVSAGANVKAVQQMLRHASAAMTLDVYADLFDDDLEAVATALHEARSAESAPRWPRHACRCRLPPTPTRWTPARNRAVITDVIAKCAMSSSRGTAPSR